MVEPSEDAKMTMEAAGSKKLDAELNDNKLEDAASTLDKKSKRKEESLANNSVNKQDDLMLSSMEESNASEKSNSIEQDNNLQKSDSENVTSVDLDVSLISAESAEESKSDNCVSDSVSNVNGKEKKVNEKSGNAGKNSDVCDLKSQDHNLPVQTEQSSDEVKIASSDKSSIEGTVIIESKVTTTSGSHEDESKKEEDCAQGDQVEKSESSEDKPGSSNVNDASNDSKGKKRKSLIVDKGGAAEEISDVAEEESKREGSSDESPNDTSKDDTPKTGTSAKREKAGRRKTVKTKQPPKEAVLKGTGRSTRSSNNPDFAAKQRSFLNKVQNAYSSIKLLDASSSMSESEGDDDLSDSSYSDGEQPNRVVPSAEKKAPVSVEKKVVALPPGLAEKLAEKSRALLTDKKLSFPFTIGDKKLAPLPGSAEKKVLAFTSTLVSANGIKRKKDPADSVSPVRAIFPNAKAVHELDEEQTLMVATSSRMEMPSSRKRKASSSAETMDGDSEDCSSPAVKITPAAIPNKKSKFLRVDETGKESQVSCDVYCWFCHREGATIMCKSCPRVYHIKCLVAPPPENSPGKFFCPLCVTITKAESTDSRSRSMKMLTLDQFCLLLSFTVSRMKSYTGSEAFCKPVDPKEFPMYSFYIVYPMDISQLERNIKNRVYGSTEAFLADASWILHNCAIFNSLNSKLTHMAKQVLKICRQEIADIENCPDCYLHAHSGNEEWFLEVCRRPHLLVWAKLKGFPFWPAKAMQCSADGMVDVRFFGAHDRAWVPAKECLLYNRSNSHPKKKKKSTLDSCIEELEKHVTKLEACFGEYVPAEGRVPLDPKKFDEQLQASLPSYKYPDAMRMPIAFSNEALVKACEENLKAAMTPYVETSAGAAREREDASQVTDEDGDVTHSDSLQSDKEETPSRRPAKKARLSRETAAKSSPKAVSGKATSSKGADRLKRETRKSGIVDRLTEKLALMDDDQSKTPPPELADTPSEEPMDTNVPQIPTTGPVAANSANESDKLPGAELVKIKIEPGIDEKSNEGETETQKSTPVSAEKDILPVSAIKQEKEDSSDSTENMMTLPARASTSTASTASTPVSSELESRLKDRESSPKDDEPVMKRRSITRASTAAATAVSVSSKPKGSSAGSKAKGKGTTPTGEGSKKGKGLKSMAGNTGITTKRKSQIDETSSAKSDTPKKDTPKKVMPANAPIGVVMSSPQEKFTARKSVPGGNNTKNISLIKSTPLPPSMSASPTILSSNVRLQTSAPSQQSVQMISSPGMPSLTVAPMARNVSLLTSSVKTSSVPTISSCPNVVSSSLGSGGSVILSAGVGSTPTPVSSVSVVTTGEASTSNMPTLSSAPTSVKSSVTTSSPLSTAVTAFAPSVSGPHAAGIRSHAAKLTEFFCGMIEDTIKDIGGKGNASATIKALQLEFERLNWQHAQEMSELRHNTTLVVEEIKKTFETEKILAVKDAVAARAALSLKEKEAAIIATKRKQWCAFCLKEALFYCCWNTSYCDYSCQQKHWPVHSIYCTQKENGDDSSTPNISGGGGPKPLIIKTPNSANGATPTVNTTSGPVSVSGTLMPIISARSSASLSSNSTTPTPTYVLATSIPSTSTTTSTIFVPAGARPAGITTSGSSARPYILPQNVRIRPNTPGQKVLLRPGVKPSTTPGQQNQVVFVVNNQKNKN